MFKPSAKVDLPVVTIVGLLANLKRNLLKNFATPPPQPVNSSAVINKTIIFFILVSFLLFLVKKTPEYPFCWFLNFINLYPTKLLLRRFPYKKLMERRTM